ncbi:MAG: hypothetical protein AAB508_00975 [Patescibacteria group bacterium]
MKKNGFSIVEMILYMGFLSAFLLVLTRILSSSLEVQTESEATTAVQQDGRYILTRLAYDIENSDIITTPSGAGQTASSLVFTIVPTTYTYTLFNGNLTRRDDIDTNNLNSANTTVTNFSVTRREGVGTKPTLSILLTVESTAQKITGVQSQTFSTTIGLR